jgi:hypothetical protein
VSQVFEWDAQSPPGHPSDGQRHHHLREAVFYGGVYAYPEDEIFDW